MWSTKGYVNRGGEILVLKRLNVSGGLILGSDGFV